LAAKQLILDYAQQTRDERILVNSIILDGLIALWEGRVEEALEIVEMAFEARGTALVPLGAPGV
jgi:hypothetical protein